MVKPTGYLSLRETYAKKNHIIERYGAFSISAAVRASPRCNCNCNSNCDSCINLKKVNVKGV